MIKNSEKLREFEDKFIRQSSLSYHKSLDIIESLWAEGVSLNVLPPKYPMEGIEVDIRIAAILNSCSKKSCQK